MKHGFVVISSMDRPVLNPGMDSNLSMVPPVCARPLPASMGTTAPHARNAGARIKLILSPTPPVECLSTAESRGGKRSPCSSMALVR